MRKKVLFVTQRMIMGGIEKALIAMLNSMQLKDYDVTVKLMSEEGELYEEIPEFVHVENIFGARETALEKMWKYTKEGDIITAVKTGFYTKLIQHTVSNYKQNRYYSRMVPRDETVYDIAIAYHSPVTFPDVYVMNNIKAKQKAVWIHCDVSYFEEALRKQGERFYSRFDCIFCVSKYAMTKFIDIFPNLKDKTFPFYNVIERDKLETLSKAEESYSDRFKGIRILTVGRLSVEKGQDMIPEILSKLLLKGYRVRWYLIGEGILREKIETMIKEYQLENNLLLLGTVKNPYPYIKDCDIYIQPSRHESYALTVAEARILRKPIITTNTGAAEQISQGETGLIVNFEKEEIYHAILRLLNDKRLREKFSSNLSQQVVDTTKEMERLYKMVENAP